MYLVCECDCGCHRAATTESGDQVVCEICFAKGCFFVNLSTETHTKERIMKTWNISNSISGADLGNYDGETAIEALNSMNDDAGAPRQDEIPEDIEITEAETTWTAWHTDGPCMIDVDYTCASRKEAARRYAEGGDWNGETEINVTVAPAGDLEDAEWFTIQI